MPPKQPAHSQPGDDRGTDDDDLPDPHTFSQMFDEHSQRLEQVLVEDRASSLRDLRSLLRENNVEMAAAVADALSRASTISARASQAFPTQPAVSAAPSESVFPPTCSVDTQPPFTRATTTDAWPPLHAGEFQPSAGTQHAAAGFPTNFPPHFAPPRPPYDAGTPFVQAQSTVAAHADPRGSHTARQRLFTVTDPPTRRDIAEAFIFVQVARHSQHIGRREIQELQLLELFVDIWDCKCIGLPPRSKLPVFDRQPSCWDRPHHKEWPPTVVVPRTVPLALPEERVPTPDPSRSPPSLPARTLPRRSEASALPPDFQPPQECLDLLHAVDALPTGLPRPLDLVLGEAQTIAVVVDGVPTLGLLQDILVPENLLAQALREAGVPGSTTPSDPAGWPSLRAVPDPAPALVSGALPRPASPSTTASSALELTTDSEVAEDLPEDDSLADAALRILQWLQRHQPHPPPDQDQQDDDDDGLRPSRSCRLTRLSDQVNQFQSSSGIGICLSEGNIAIIASRPAPIYLRELWAVLLALLLAPPRTRVVTDNRAVYQALTRGHGHTLTPPEALAATHQMPTATCQHFHMLRGL
ncbi:hypothetical protein ISCGN_007850 [Ixodes scapularis]